MIINIIGHGLQWFEEVAQEFAIPANPLFNSVSFYCQAGNGFNGPDARLIVNGEWHGFVQEINEIHHIPEHFVFPNLMAWSDIVPRNPNDLNPPNLDEPHYVAPNVVHQIDGVNILRLRQIIRPGNPYNESQLAISPIEGTCISLSWLISNIPLIIEDHQQLADMPNHNNYTFRWLVCRDLIAGLNPNDNSASMNTINREIGNLGGVNRLLWQP